MGIALALAVGALVMTATWPDATEREASRWLNDFHRVRQATDGARLPDWPLSFAGQRLLVKRLVQPESRMAREWEGFRRVLPPVIRSLTPSLPLARDQAIAIGPALIELPKMPALRMALLEAALATNAANRHYAVQFAGTDWPVPVTLLPLLERLAADPDPAIRTQVALVLHGIPPGHPEVERLIVLLQGDQVSVVRETAHYSFRSDATGETIPWPPKDATRP